MAFVKRKISLTFLLGTGSFGEGGEDAVEVSGLRTRARITEYGGDSMGQAEIRVQGLPMGTMKKISALNQNSMLRRKNGVIVTAGDDTGMSTVFKGQITIGQIDLRSSPDTALNVVALSGLWEAVKPVPPISYAGSADAAEIMKSLASQMGYGFENNGVSVQLSTPYFWGSLREQARRCAENSHIRWIISNGVLAIWPWDGNRKGDVPLIAPETGLIGYPGYTSSFYGISADCLYNPAIKYGGIVEVQSGQLGPNGQRTGGLEVANGRWVVWSLIHDLSSEMPNGPWFTSFQCSPVNWEN